MANAPTIREPCCVAWFRARAFSRCSLGTRFGIRAVATVIWAARRVPLNRARNMSIQGPAWPFITRNARTRLCNRLRANIQRKSVWRSTRSARYPTMGVENTRGTMAAKVMIPTHIDSPVSSHASQPRATINAHAAAPEQVVAIHIVR